MTRVVNLFRDKDYDVYIGRAGHGQDGYFGNPFPLPSRASDTDRAKCLKDFETYFIDRMYTDAEFNRRVLELKGKTLGCFCKPKACHGDVIAGWIDSDYQG